MKKYLLIPILTLALFGAGCLSGPKVDFKLPTVNGTQFEFDSKTDAKNRPIFLAFMATYCGYCKMSVPLVVDLENNYGPKGLKVIGVFSDNAKQGPEAYIKENNINYDVVFNGGSLAQDCKVNGVPHFVLLNKKHEMVKIWSGYNPQHTFAEEIEKVL